jgi:hypothetical protein
MKRNHEISIIRLPSVRRLNISFFEYHLKIIFYLFLMNFHIKRDLIALSKCTTFSPVFFPTFSTQTNIKKEVRVKGKNRLCWFLCFHLPFSARSLLAHNVNWGTYQPCSVVVVERERKKIMDVYSLTFFVPSVFTCNIKLYLTEFYGDNERK